MAYPILDEEWRSVDGFDDYMVSDNGRVARILSSRPNVSGYPRVTLCEGTDKRREVLTHRLVLETFVGPCPDGMEACHHPDNSPSNASLDNLRWDTPSANNQDKIEAGTHLCGSDHPSSKINETDVERMFDLRKNGCTPKEIGEWFDLSFSHVRQILNGKCWSHYKGAK